MPRVWPVLPDRGPGTTTSMAATEKEQQELEQIERQVAEMESNGPDESTRRQIAKLQDRIDQLRRDRKSTRLNSSHRSLSRMPSSA